MTHTSIQTCDPHIFLRKLGSHYTNSSLQSEILNSKILYLFTSVYGLPLGMGQYQWVITAEPWAFSAAPSSVLLHTVLWTRRLLKTTSDTPNQGISVEKISPLMPSPSEHLQRLMALEATLMFLDQLPPTKDLNIPSASTLRYLLILHKLSRQVQRQLCSKSLWNLHLCCKNSCIHENLAARICWIKCWKPVNQRPLVILPSF